MFIYRGVTSYELSGLKPYCMYEIKISVQDKNNRKSEFSQKIQLRTLQGGIKSFNYCYQNYVLISTIFFSSRYSRTDRMALDKC